MKTKWFRLGLPGLILVGLSAWWTAARAYEPSSGHTVVTGADQVIGDDFMAAGSTVDVRARVKGDVVTAAGNVTISGPVEGDVMAAGGTVHLLGLVGDDVRVMGGTVIVSAPIKDNALLTGGTLVLQPEARVGHDAYIAGGDIQIQGPIGRNLSLTAGKVALASSVGGDLRAEVDQISLQPGAVVHGNLIVHGPNPPQISPGAQVLGRVDYSRTISRAERDSSAASRFNAWLIRFLWLMVLGAAFLAVSRRWADRVSETMTRQPGLSFAAGFLGVTLAPVIILILLITLIGMPLALVLTAVYGILLLLSGIFAAYRIGTWLLQKAGRPQASPYARLALGAAFVPLLTMLPWIGWIVGLLIVLLGFGALFLERRSFLLQLRAQELA